MNNNRFELYDVVRLKKPNEEYGIQTDVEGVIVYVQGNHEAYTIEFIDSNGVTFEEALFHDFKPEEIELVENG